jgi:hypothetical protein
MQKIAYEKHPVSAERKAELRAGGFKILDVRFKPADAEQEEPAKRPYVRKDDKK